jgi:hypothetical protein
LQRYAPLLAIFAITFGLLVNEVLLSAIFSVLIGDYNTITAIAVALLGLSSAGIVVYTVPALRNPANASRLLAAFVIATAVCTTAIMALPINHGDFSYVQSTAAETWKVVAYLVAIVPFFAGGLTINVLLAANAERVGQLYACDLAGAAVGCLAAVAALGPLSAPLAIIVSTVPAAVLVRADRRQRFGWWWVAPALVAAIFVLDAMRVPLLDVKRFNTLGEVNHSQYRAFPATGKDLDYERWSLDAWTIVRKPTIPQQWENFRGWGVSRRYDGTVPPLALVNYNLRYSTYATQFDGDLAKISRWPDERSRSSTCSAASSATSSTSGPAAAARCSTRSTTARAR